LAASTLIILFVEILNFLKQYFFRAHTFEKKTREYCETNMNILLLKKKTSKLIKLFNKIRVEAGLALLL
jgi:hypothetical protein